jgi:hypothetical protein
MIMTYVQLQHFEFQIFLALWSSKIYTYSKVKDQQILDNNYLIFWGMKMLNMFAYYVFFYVT